MMQSKPVPGSRSIRRSIVLFVVAAVLVSLLSAAAPGALPASAQPASGAQARTVHLFYMIGANLSMHGSDWIDKLVALADGSGTPNRFVFRAGGAARWYSESIALRADRNSDFEIFCDQSGASGIELYDQAVGSMGEAATLSAFITRYVRQYDDGRTRFHLVLWDHGGGPNGGFGTDELYGGDGLTPAELERALSDAHAATGVKLGLVDFNACLMSSVEIASVVAPHADWMLASEDIGWLTDEQQLPAVLLDPDAADVDVAGGWMDAYRDMVETVDEEYVTRTRSWALTDLSGIPALETAVGALGRRLQADLADRDTFRILMAARDRVHAFGALENTRDHRDLADLKSLAEELSDMHPAECADVLEALSRCVRRVDVSDEHAGSGGLHVFAPHEGGPLMVSRASKHALTGFNPEWRAYVTAAVDALMLAPASREVADGGSLDHDAAGRLRLTLPEEQWAGVRQITWFVGTVVGEKNTFVTDYPVADREDGMAVVVGDTAPFRFMVGAEPLEARLVSATDDEWRYSFLLASNQHGGAVVSPGGSLVSSSFTTEDGTEIETDDPQMAPGEKIQAWRAGWYPYGTDPLSGLQTWTGTWTISTIPLPTPATARVAPYDPGLVGFRVVTWTGDETLYWEAGGVYNRHTLAGGGASGLRHSAWAREAVLNEMSRGMLRDLPFTDLTKPITRLELATLLVNHYELTAAATIVVGERDPFADTRSVIARKAWQMGFIKGRSADGKLLFDPGNAISREDLAVMLVRWLAAMYADFDEPQAGQPDAALRAATDAGSVSGYARAAMAWMMENGYLKGTVRMGADGVGRTYADPKGGASIEQTLAVLDRLQNGFEGRPTRRQTVPETETKLPLMAYANYLNGRVTLVNYGEAPIDLSGWTAVPDAFALMFEFPSGSVLQPGESFYLLTGPSAKAAAVEPGTFLWTRADVFAKRLDSYTGALFDASGLKAGTIDRQIILEAK